MGRAIASLICYNWWTALAFNFAVWGIIWACFSGSYSTLAILALLHVWVGLWLR